ncbi:MAG: clostripain-related cysteine peptidase [Oscillospiraceae bacterium]
MKLERITAAIIGISMLLTATACSFISEYEDNDSDSSSAVSAANTTSVDSGEGGAAAGSDRGEFTSGATRLSVSNGSIGITRRTLDNVQPMGEDNWTIMLYMCGTDLESDYGAATSDLYEAISAQYDENVRLVVQTGGTNTWQFGIDSEHLYRFENTDGDLNLVEELPLAPMGDPDTLTDFVTWGVENYPAEHMALVFWDHGGGSIAGVCVDELFDYDTLSLSEINYALNSAMDSMTDKFEFIGFDACLMSTFENANILAPYARYMFASEETEPGGGWNYTDIMSFLAQNNDATGAELGAFQCDSYYQHCIDNGDWEGSTFAIVDLSKIDSLVTEFDAAAKEIYELDAVPSFARLFMDVDNFGGNNRSEGYTNMVDMGGFLDAAAPYAPSAAQARKALDAAVISCINGPQHSGASGLSMYYPLSVQGTQELSIFTDICTSAYYLAFVDQVAYGTTGGMLSEHDSSGIIADCDDIWAEGISFGDVDYSTNTDGFENLSESSYINLAYEYFDEEGYYTVQLESTDYLYTAACSLFLQVDDTCLFLGEDDEVNVDYDNGIIKDAFDGSWVTLNGVIMPIIFVDGDENYSIYTCEITLNGEYTNLRIEYDWNAGKWQVLGIWAGIDSDTGMAARDVVKLKDGDVIAPVFRYYEGEYEDYFIGDEFVVNGEIEVYYDYLPAADYLYSFALYDVFGNCYYTDYITLTVEEDGSITYYEDELEYGYYE